MESVIIYPKSKTDLKLLNSFAKKMGFSMRILDDEEKEELGLKRAMEGGKKTKLVPRSRIMKKLNRNGKSISR